MLISGRSRGALPLAVMVLLLPALPALLAHAS
jgi:hypothetical protein